MSKAIIYDYSALRGLIRTKFKTENNFVRALENTPAKLSIHTFNNKINGKSYFKDVEITCIAKVLNISKEEICKYFFEQNYEFNS